MGFDPFSSAADTIRLRRVIERIAAHGLSRHAVAGGLALEWRLADLGHGPDLRDDRDVDLLVEGFGAIPRSLAESFLVRHCHLAAPEGKLLLQLVAPGESLRVDIFRARGKTLDRSGPVRFDGRSVETASLEDLACRLSSRVGELARGSRVPRKHARDFLRAVGAADPDGSEVAWTDHRLPWEPATSREAACLGRMLIRSRPDLLFDPEYSRDPHEVCARCERTADFPLADARRVLEILGYC